ncbi:MAG TPA: cytochrome c [Candidatus Sulfotelmatobacter sp.]|nr:cytochrome c [Candidatus Sulfotelmatobacter sp.]
MPRTTRLVWPLVTAVALACQARAPSRLETTVVTQLKRRVTVGGRGDANPLGDAPELVALGREDFSHYCMVCHGLDGHNTGVPFAAAMSPPVPSLTSPEIQAYTDGQLHWIIRNGLFPSGMPASRDLLNDEEMWRIVLYRRHLPPPGSLGEPAVYADPAAGADDARRPAAAQVHNPAP